MAIFGTSWSEEAEEDKKNYDKPLFGSSFKEPSANDFTVYTDELKVDLEEAKILLRNVLYYVPAHNRTLRNEITRLLNK